MNKVENIFLRNIEIAEPTKFISSKEIESDLSAVYDRLKLPYGRIEMQTGVVNRGVFPTDLPSQIAEKAARKILDNFEASEIDGLIYCGVCRNYLEPSTASSIHHYLGLRDDCFSFDLSNACLGMVNGVQLASQFLTAGTAKNILLVTGENSFPLLSNTLETLKSGQHTRKEIKKFFANFTIGSAGVAMLISSESPAAMAKIERYSNLSDTSTYKLCQGGGDTANLTMETDSEALMQAGIKLAQKNWQQFSEVSYQHFITHQVGVHHRNFLYDQLNLDLSKDTTTFDRYGNTGSAALPLTLYHASSKIKSGEKVALLGIGSGLHTSIMELTWI